MIRITLKTPTHIYLLRCRDDVEVLEEATIDVTSPDWLEGGRMPVEAWQVRDLIVWEDGDGLAEIGIEVIDSVPRRSLN
jgi:hypothetical protein